MKKRRDIAIEMLKNYQKEYLEKIYPNKYESVMKEINGKDNFETFIANTIESDINLSRSEKDKIINELTREIETTNFLNTEYESFSEWKILKDVYDQFASLNPSYDLKDKLFLGTILSDQISAGTSYEEDIDALFILFDGELINLSLQLSKLIAQSVPLSEIPPHILFPIDLDELRKNIVDNGEIKGRIIGGLFFALHKKPKQFTRYLLNDDLQNRVAYILIQSIEYFVFSHEVGHYLNGDLRTDKEKLDPEGIIKRDWHEEFMADLFGLNKIVELFKSNKDYLSLLGPEIFFNFLILRERHDKRVKDVGSHPPATDRLNTYRIFLMNFLDEIDQTELNKYQKLIDDLFKYYEIIVVSFSKFNEELKKK